MVSLILHIYINVNCGGAILDLPNRMDGKPKSAQKEWTHQLFLRQRYTDDVAKQL